MQWDLIKSSQCSLFVHELVLAVCLISKSQLLWLLVVKMPVSNILLISNFMFSFTQQTLARTPPVSPARLTKRAVMQRPLLLPSTGERLLKSLETKETVL